jgi:hypothetical protein
LAQPWRELHTAYPLTPAPEISREIMGLLNDWRVELILKVDKRYGDFLVARLH